jgi:hypothetical protein
MGKILIIAGTLMVIAGLILQFAPKFPLPGKLPGDIIINRENFRIYFPITTSILISLLITLILFLVHRAKQ